MTWNITTALPLPGWAASPLQDNQNEVTREITSSGGCGGVDDDDDDDDHHHHHDDDDSNNFKGGVKDVRKYAYLRSKVAQCKLMESNATPT